MVVDGALRMHSSRVPRTVSPPSAVALERESKRLSDRTFPIHKKDRNEKNKKTRRKRSTDNGELHAQKSPPNKTNEFENIHPNVNIKTKTSESATKFIKSRELFNRKGATGGTTKRKTKDRQAAVPHKNLQATVLPNSIEQQELNRNKQRWPAIDTIKRRRPEGPTNHNQRPQIVMSPEHTERQKPATSPERNATLFDDSKRRKPPASAPQTDLGKPVTSPDHAERRKLAASPNRIDGRQPTSPPEGPNQRSATTTKGDDKRKRRLLVRGDSRAAAVAEAVAKCSSNSACPVWLRRR